MPYKKTTNKDSMIISVLAGGSFLGIYLLGLFGVSNHISNIRPAETHTQFLLVNTENSEVKSPIKFLGNKFPIPSEPNLEDLANSKYFDETQYASDHWDEFLEDPENIDDFPENIFDAQLE